ncbi:MAG: cell division protein SepF [Alkalibacterium gilvum]|uniref:Cell division protein SepF n=1 Tax=Alkalibacterium gilvum TaxID=1130080 RepID=A0A1H6U249_9LACT|nr:MULTISPECIES: cell division protein SepF [Alkalibacterium]MDN6293121.1 cell division protein SepF [Alkalibacterium sp.]MDN6295066.1 cell division protein SepF [Alkalibacterium sp.]MDN6398126.1 cell division protein SepF [Alkalibacterium sp.]MDN6729229.1 cell division protein SepF [Alkalibacterium sp.]SEI82490.1 cell division inhibitor SepF [Alkalibacterium gilvum]
MSLKDKFNDYFSLNDTDDDFEYDDTEKIAQKESKKSSQSLSVDNRRVSHKSKNQNIVAINQQQAIKKPKIKVVEPRLYSEVQSIADILLNNQSVILNFRRMEKKQAKKMLDFLMGTTYAVKGDIERLGEEIFICTPQSFEIDGSELQSLQNNEF